MTDTYREGKGAWEHEQWVTWRTRKLDDHGYDRIDFRHEFEFGITDYFDLGIYVSNWHYEDSRDTEGAEWDSAALEGIVYFSNPVTDVVGVGLYGEVAIGEDEIEIENKLLVQKDIGKWTFLYNLILETEIEHEDGENEVEGVLGHAFGVSYAVDPAWKLGGELLVESTCEDWHEYGDTTVYASPAVNYVGDQLFNGPTRWVTVTAAVQLTDNDEEPDFLVRMIAGLEF